MLAIVRAMAPGVLAYATPPSKDTKGDHVAFVAWLTATRPEGRDWREAWTRFQKERERGPAEQPQAAPPATLPEVPTSAIETAVVEVPAPLSIQTTEKAQPDPTPEPAATVPVRTFLIAIPVLV